MKSKIRMRGVYRGELVGAVLAVVVLLGTAGSAAGQQPVRWSDLPQLALAPARPSTELGAAAVAVRSAMTVRLQRPPPRLNMEKFNRWARTRFSPWVRRRQAATQIAQAALASLARSSDPRDPVIGGAFSAILSDDFALQVSSMPRPASIQNDPALGQAYDQALEGVIAPMLRQAAEHYEFCAARPGAPEWSAFCTQRLTVLRASGRVSTPSAAP